MKSKIVFAISLLFGLMMINSGLNKFLNYMPWPEMPEPAMNLMTAFMESGWVFPLVAVAEIVGGILFILPKYRALGAIVLFPVVVGIFLFHAVLEPSTMPVAIIILAINLYVIYENREKYMPMIKS
ncbi:DoxX family protein [Fulvivirga lutea]|uniref:DoxX family protein n=1 Tax=Fulvivirga lutea TaxID=2810512 RepID=A0A974ZZX2_9BACT|nr:DoxX family protein [Fulvivirga lutea]QSE95862.1 DoxX family protein [Fulvivirga lutea]